MRKIHNILPQNAIDFLSKNWTKNDGLNRLSLHFIALYAFIMLPLCHRIKSTNRWAKKNVTTNFHLIILKWNMDPIKLCVRWRLINVFTLPIIIIIGCATKYVDRLKLLFVAIDIGIEMCVFFEVKCYHYINIFMMGMHKHMRISFEYLICN